VFFDMPRMDVSSSLIRRHARAARPIRYYVPDKVAGFIEDQNLYGTSSPVGAAS
jgi:nicotinate-nucleotide adenylyltransferase